MRARRCNIAGTPGLSRRWRSKASRRRIQYLVGSNLGITLLPEMVLGHRVGQRIAMVRIQSLTPRRTVVATGRPGRYLSTNARQFFWCAETVAASWQRSSNDG